MRYGVYFPTYGDFADARLLADMAREAEAAGWDGFFLWDHLALNWPEHVVDSTVALAAVATVTSRIRFGPMVTAPTRRRPWKLAREVASLDRAVWWPPHLRRRPGHLR